MALTLANQIQLITKYSPDAFDQVYQRDAISSMLTMDKSLVKFSVDNARIVKIPKLALGGLRDYDRNNIDLGTPEGMLPVADSDGNIVGTRGYQKGASSWVWETREMTQDRQIEYDIEYFDNEESGEKMVGHVIAESSRTVVVPEVDAYTFAKIASEIERYDLGNYVSGTINANAPLAEFNKGLLWLDDHQVDQTNRIAFVSTAFFNNLRSTPELYRKLDATGETDKKVSFRIVSYEGIPLVVVPPARFNTGYAKLPLGGYGFTKDAPAIDFIVMDKGAAVQVIKYNKVKVLSGDLAIATSGMDGFAVFVRVYYDCFVFDNKAPGIYVHVGGYDGGKTPEAAKGNFSIVVNKDGIVQSILEMPAGRLTRVYQTTRSEIPAIGSAWTTDLTTDIGVAEGTAWAEATVDPIILVGVQGGIVVACKDLTIAGTQGSFVITVEDHTYGG